MCCFENTRPLLVPSSRDGLERERQDFALTHGPFKMRAAVFVGKKFTA